MAKGQTKKGGSSGKDSASADRPVEHPRSLNEGRKRTTDRALTPNRPSGGYDTKG